MSAHVRLKDLNLHDIVVPFSHEIAQMYHCQIICYKDDWTIRVNANPKSSLSDQAYAMKVESENELD